jgi:spermidine synthase
MVLNISPNKILLPAVVACFILSGFSALLYQTVWMRQFSVVFGTSELAVATVLSAYMGGLALGAALAGWFVTRMSRPVLVYGVLEGLIAVSALCVPLLLWLATVLYTGLLGGQPELVDAGGLGQSVFYFLVAFVVLLIPTTCMGATLPLLSKYVVHTDDQVGSRVGGLYASNTLGAVAGTLVAGFLLLPAVGLRATVWTGVAVNLLVFGIVVAIAGRVTTDTSGSDLPHRAPAKNSALKPFRFHAAGRQWILPLMLLSGANTFVYEVLWTRLLSHILGGSITAFATMLASFLAGIAVGSALSARLAGSVNRALAGFIFVQCGIALTSLLIYQFLPLLIPAQAGLSGNSGLAIMILFPATLFIGATFPFAVRLMADRAEDAAPASARVYAWNTLGAIAGAAIAGFWLVPLLKYEGAVKLAVSVNLFLALAASLLVVKRHYRLAALMGVLLVALLAAYHPQPPLKILMTSPVADSRDGDIRFYEVGRSATVLLLEKGGYFNLRTNGLPEASTNLKGAPPYQHNQRLLSTLPVLARPHAREMLIIGLGAGVAAENVPPTVDAIDVVELEPKVVAANRLIAAEREIDPLADPRVKVIVNDARSALMLTSKTYDAIVSQPSHPWTAGASHLYTREFMALAEQRLKPDGVYLQWMHNQFVNESLLKSLASTMLDVFDYVRIYQWEPEVLFFLGSNSPLAMEQAIAGTGMPLRDHPVHYLEKGIGSVEDVLVALLMDEENVRRFAQGSLVLTDNNNRMATESAAAMDARTTISFGEFVELTTPYNPLLQADSWIHTDFSVDLEFSYIARRLSQRGFKQQAIDLARLLTDTSDPEALLLTGLGLEEQGDRAAAQSTLLTAYAQDPGNRQQIQAALIKPWLSRLADRQVPRHLEDVIKDLVPPVAAVTYGWHAARDKQWGVLARLDAQLALLRPTDLLYLEAVKLRADWRIKVTSPQHQPALALEAMQLIDKAIAIFHDPDFYTLRLAAALVADRPDEVIETSRRLVHIFEGEIDRAEKGLEKIDRNAVLHKLQQAATVRVVVDKMNARHTIPESKLQYLQQRLVRIDSRLNAL